MFQLTRAEDYFISSLVAHLPWVEGIIGAGWAVMATSGLEQSRAAAVPQQTMRRQGRRGSALMPSVWCWQRGRAVVLSTVGHISLRCFLRLVSTSPWLAIWLLGSCH